MPTDRRSILSTVCNAAWGSHYGSWRGSYKVDAQTPPWFGAIFAIFLVSYNSVAQTQALHPPSLQPEAMGNRAAKPAGGPPAEGGAPNSAATGCMAIPQRFCGTCFHCIAVGFGFTYDMFKCALTSLQQRFIPESARNCLCSLYAA